MHLALADYIEGLVVDLDAVAGVYCCDREELQRLFNAGVRYWETFRQGRYDYQVEAALKHAQAGIELSGHLDVVCRDVILDWKTGRKDSNYYHQLMGYAWLWFQDRDTTDPFDELQDDVTIRVVWLRTGEVEDRMVTFTEAQMWFGRLEATVKNAERYSPGDHCELCPRRFSCPARQQLVKSQVESFGQYIPQDLGSMPGDQLVQLRRRAETVRRVAEGLQKEIRSVVLSRGEVRGETYGLTTYQENRRKIFPLKAWELLDSLFTDAELADAMNLSMTKLEALVRDRAKRGEKDAAVAAFRKSLEDMGAVVDVPVTKVRETRTKRLGEGSGE